MILVKTKDLKKYYQNGKIKAVDGVDIVIESDNIYGIIGPNGAGKTTLIKLILKAINKTNGELHILKTVRMGLVSEKHALPFDSYAYEYLYTIGILAKLKREVILKRIITLATQFGLIEYIHSKIKTYSSGMKKKLQIIAALIDYPDVLILDEPTANLDPVFRIDILEQIKFLAENKKITIIICSHNLDELEKIVNKIIMMKKGKVIYNGDLEDINNINNHYEVVIHTDNDDKMKKYLKNKHMEVTNEKPITFITDNIDMISKQIIKFAYQENLIIKDFYRKKRTLMDSFTYLNSNRGH